MIMEKLESLFPNKGRADFYYKRVPPRQEEVFLSGLIMRDDVIMAPYGVA